MPTRKIKDIALPCSHPEHFPPKHQVFEPGVYEHTCPACGHITIFTVPAITCNSKYWTYTGPAIETSLPDFSIQGPSNITYKDGAPEKLEYTPSKEQLEWEERTLKTCEEAKARLDEYHSKLIALAKESRELMRKKGLLDNMED